MPGGQLALSLGQPTMAGALSSASVPAGTVSPSVSSLPQALIPMPTTGSSSMSRSTGMISDPMISQDETGRQIYNLQGLLGTTVIATPPAVKGGSQRTKGKPERSYREEESEDYFVDIADLDVPACSLPVFTQTLDSADAYSYKSIQPNHDRALSPDHPTTLLPDTGAVENLIGAKRAQEFHHLAQQMGQKARWTKLHKPKLVSGVGGSAQVIQHQLHVSGYVAPGVQVHYHAPVIDGPSAGVPALFGLKEQTRACCVLLPNMEVMKLLPDPASEAKIVWPAGTRTIPMSKAPSKHLLISLPHEA